MNTSTTNPEDSSLFEPYDHILKTYKKLNGIINMYDEWEKHLQDKDESNKKFSQQIEKKRTENDKDLTSYLEQLRVLEKSIQEASKVYI